MESLTSEKLSKLCRICLNEGEINLWKHKVRIPISSNGNFFEESKEGELEAPCEEEILVQNLLLIFDKCKTAVFEIGKEMQLLCQECLHQLINCYIFYTKIKGANMQIQKLYKQALDVEKTSNRDEFSENEEIEYLDDEFIDNEVTEQHHVRKKHIPTIRKSCKYPRLLLTGGVKKMLTHVHYTTKDDSANETLPVSRSKRPCVSNNAVDDNKNTPQKRQRLQKSQTEKEKPNLENTSLLVGQFIPSLVTSVDFSAANKEDMISPDLEYSVDAALQTQLTELRTVDFAPLQISAVDDIQQKVEAVFEPASTSAVNKSGADTSAIYVCKFCPKAFAAPHYLVSHIRNCHACKFCTQSFNQTQDLFDHIRQEHEQHKCAICSKELTSHSNLRAHIKRMHGITLPAQVALLQESVTTEEVVLPFNYQNEVQEETEENDTGNVVYELTESTSPTQDTNPPENFFFQIEPADNLKQL